jgi:hypothetical protein
MRLGNGQRTHFSQNALKSAGHGADKPIMNVSWSYLQRVPFRLRRVLAAAALVVAFLVMASIFSPDRSKAGSYAPPNEPPRRSNPTTSAAGIMQEADESSTNPHEGLRSLGTLEYAKCAVQIYSTPVGPRYSIYDLASHKLLGTLLSAEQVNLQFPELKLPQTDFSADQDQAIGPVMMGDPH